VSELEDCWGSVIVSCCCEKLVGEAGESSGTQRKGNFLLWKPLSSNDSEDVAMDTNVFVVAVYCNV
jgi:hypothetical protein